MVEKSASRSSRFVWRLLLVDIPTIVFGSLLLDGNRHYPKGQSASLCARHDSSRHAMPRKPHFEVASGKALREKYGLTAKNRPTIRLTPSRVPRKFRRWIALAERWGMKTNAECQGRWSQSRFAPSVFKEVAGLPDSGVESVRPTMRCSAWLRHCCKPGALASPSLS